MPERQLHILFVASWYPNRNAPGLGNFIQRHAQAAALMNKISVVYAIADKNLDERKIEVSENHSGNLSEYIIYYGKIKSSFPIISQLKKRNAYRKAIRTGVDLAKKQNGSPDLLHVHVIWPAAIGVLPLLKELNVPLLITEHWSGYLPEDGNYKGMIMKRFSKQLAEKAKHITVVSKKMEESMRRHGLGKSFSQLPNTVDTKIFHTKPHVYTYGKFNMLHVSALVDREKNISGILRVMKQLESRPDITLQIAGDGPERPQHENFAKESGLLNKTVFFLGYKSPEEIAALMNQSDVLLMFSHFEGMPVTIIEAFCCGLGVIATRTGAIPELVREYEAEDFLVEPGDEKALFNLITEFSGDQIENNDEVMEQKEYISKIAVAKYGYKSVSKVLDNLYRSILKDNER